MTVEMSGGTYEVKEAKYVAIANYSFFFLDKDMIPIPSGGIYTMRQDGCNGSYEVRREFDFGAVSRWNLTGFAIITEEGKVFPMVRSTGKYCILPDWRKGLASLSDWPEWQIGKKAW